MPVLEANGNGTPQILGANGQPIRHQQVQAALSSSFALPHVLTFSGIYGSAQRVYRWSFDEALKNNPENAKGMRRDPHLLSLLRERQLATAQLSWHLEPDDEEDAFQKTVADDLTRIIKAIPRLQRMFMALLEAVWFGRYAVQVLWGWQPYRGARVMTVLKHIPVHGDKIQYRYRLPGDAEHIQEGTPVLLTHATYTSDLPGAQTVLTDRGRGLLLEGSWRERFIIHSHEPDDADFFDGEMAGGIYGVGIRSRIYWLWWLKQEWLSFIHEYMERVGLGVTIWYYESGNAEAKKEAEKQARDQSRNLNIVWPRSVGAENQGSGIERLEVPTQGAEILLKLQQYVDDVLQRYIVGQSLSGNAESTGLGSSVADLHAQTKYKIVRYDAQNLEETLTGDLVEPIKRWSYPSADFPVRFVFDVDRPDAKDQLDAAKSLYDMGIELDADEVRGTAGYSKPAEGAETVQKQPELPFGGMMPGGSGAAFGFGNDQGKFQQDGDSEEQDQDDEGLFGSDWSDDDEDPRGPFGKDEAEDFSRRGQVTRYARDDSCQWVTIGGRKGENGKRKGGSQVCIQQGRIVKGHPRLAGKSLGGSGKGPQQTADQVGDRLWQDYQSRRGNTPESSAQAWADHQASLHKAGILSTFSGYKFRDDSPHLKPKGLAEGPPESMRAANARSREYARAVAAKAARKEGISPKDPDPADQDDAEPTRYASKEHIEKLERDVQLLKDMIEPGEQPTLPNVDINDQDVATKTVAYLISLGMDKDEAKAAVKSLQKSTP